MLEIDDAYIVKDECVENCYEKWFNKFISLRIKKSK